MKKFLRKCGFVFFNIMLCTGVMVAMSVPAAAYLDASALTYTIQIGVGVVIAVGAAIGIIVTKLKKKAKDKLNIDLDTKKDVEDDVVSYRNTVKTNDEVNDNKEI